MNNMEITDINNRIFRIGDDTPTQRRVNKYANQVFINNYGGNSFLNVLVPVLPNPDLTNSRKMAINKQLLRFITNKHYEPTDLNKLIYLTFEVMPFESLQDLISKALWNFTDFDISNDAGIISTIERVFTDQKKVIDDWLLSIGYDYEQYNGVLSNMDRIDNRIKYAIVQQMQEIEKVENIFGNLWWVGGFVVLAIILFFVFKRVFKKDRSK